MESPLPVDPVREPDTEQDWSFGPLSWDLSLPGVKDPHNASLGVWRAEATTSSAPQTLGNATSISGLSLSIE